MLSDKELYENLRQKRDNGDTLKPAERAKLRELEKSLGDNKKSKAMSNRKSELLESDPSSKQPKLIRFVLAERDTLRGRKDALLDEATPEVKEALGSINAASEDLMVRAAVLALESMPNKKLISFMKKALMNN